MNVALRCWRIRHTTSMLSSVENQPGRLAIVMSGGGARAAYQVGLLQTLAKHPRWLRSGWD